MITMDAVMTTDHMVPWIKWTKKYSIFLFIQINMNTQY